MTKIVVDAEIFNQLLHDLWTCLNDSSEMTVGVDVLDHLIKDQFQKSEFNEIGREFLIEGYKNSLLEKATALEESLQMVLEQARKLSLEKTVTGQLLSVSADCPVTVPAAQEVTPCLSCQAVEQLVG